MGNLTGINSDELCCRICKENGQIINKEKFLSREDNKDMVNNYLSNIRNDKEYNENNQNTKPFDISSKNSKIRNGLKKLNRQLNENIKIGNNDFNSNNNPDMSSEIYTLSNDRYNEDDSESFLNDNNDNYNNEKFDEKNNNDSKSNNNNSTYDKNKSKSSLIKKNLYIQIGNKDKFEKSEIEAIQQYTYYKKLLKSKESGKSLMTNKVKDIILLKSYFSKIFRTGIEHMNGEVKLFLVITKDKILIYKDELHFTNFQKPIESINIKLINSINVNKTNKRKEITIDYFKTIIDKTKRKFLELELVEEEHNEFSNFEMFVSLIYFISSNF